MSRHLPGLSKADGANALGTNYRVNAAELARLRHEVGFKSVDVKADTFVMTWMI